MKKVVLFFTVVLMGLTSVSAFEADHHKPKHKNKILTNYRYAQPIVFVERGVEFLIFPDGNFDFNTDAYREYYQNNFYRRNRRSVNTTYGAPYSRYHRNSGVFIAHDRDGKVRRIGNVYLNYDRFGRIKRAGTVYMNYTYGRRHVTLSQVGGLRVHYNRWGEIVNAQGRVNRNSPYGETLCTPNHRYDRDDDDDDWFDNRDDDRYDDDGIYNDDDNFYYYKQNGTVKKHKKHRR